MASSAADLQYWIQPKLGSGTVTISTDGLR
jgi:hypothetical protein